MELSILDIGVFLAFFGFVVGFSMYKSRHEKDSESYFLAGRGLVWPLIGFSIVAANLSTEQFVGMAGQGASSVGLAVSLWQLAGSLGIIVVAFTLLPRFLRAGIYTMPEYLEYRYNGAARAIMAFYAMVIYVTVTSTAVLYSGGLTLSTIFEGLTLTQAVWIIGGIAALYTTWGGLKAVAWADLFQGAALLIGGLVTLWLCVRATGGVESFAAEHRVQLHLILPADHPTLPWTGVLFGMWIPIIYYCGLNQFIVQRTLAAKSLKQGQLGIILAAALWILVPFAIVLPGMAAFSLYSSDMAAQADDENASALAEFEKAQAAGEDAMVVYEFDEDWRRRRPEQAERLSQHNAAATASAKQRSLKPETRKLATYKYDAAYPLLVSKLIPDGIRGIMFAAIAGAVISSLASMLNSAATIFTMDIFKRNVCPEASQKTLVLIGRIMTLLFVVIGCLLAPTLSDPRFKGVFNFIQDYQGYISPGVVAVFLIGFLVPQAPGAAGVAALLVNAPVYGLLQWQFGDIHFLNRMMITFCVVAAIMLAIRWWKPLPAPRVMPVRESIELESAPIVYVAAAAVIGLVVAFVVTFW